jgi:serine/threonine-protein kinase
MSFTIGQTVGPYRITEKLGQGGMATVYKAYHANLDRYVAIKVLHVAFRQDKSFLDRFQREAQIVAKLEHPHIVPIYDYADLDGQPYLVMKFLEGETLKKRMRRQPLSLDDIPPILNPVAAALDYAFRHDVLHRDVKPSNIVIDKDNTPFLADFGLARIASTGESTLSQDMMLGTPQYISPEQAQGNQHLDAGTDIYSLGVVLYEIVVGRVPFSADTPYSIIHDHIYTPLPLPSHVNPNVPLSIETVLLKALSKQRADRYKTAGDLAKAFVSAIDTRDSEAIQIHPASTTSDASDSIEIDLSSSVSKTKSDSPEVIPVQKVDGNALVRPAALPPPPPRPSPNIPAPGPFPTPPMGTTPPPGSILIPGSSVVNQQQQSSGNGWVISGCIIAVLTCLLSIGIVMSTLNDPRLESQSNSNIPIDQQILEAARDDNLTESQAQKYFDDYPDEPAAHFAMALIQLEGGEPQEARETVEAVLNDLEPSGQTIADWADVISTMGYDEDAILLYITAMAADSSNAKIHNQAGSYIYSQAENVSVENVEIFCNLAESYPQIAFVEAMLGQALISVNVETFEPDGDLPETCLTYAQNEDFSTVEDLITHSLELDNTSAEGYLILGNYYAGQAEIDQAIDNWATASELPNAPAWVKTDAQDKLESQPN